ncbi:MAG: sensor histidine kinase [Bacteroidota bacterium]
MKPLHSTIALCFGFGAFELFRKTNKTRFALMVAITYLLFSLAWLNSAILAIVESSGIKYFDGTTNREFVIWVTAALNMIVASVGYLLMLKDLNEKEIDEKNLQIESDNKKLTALNNQKDKFFSIIAHDLKGPIGGLLNLGEVLQKKYDQVSPEKREELFRLLVNSAKETSNLLENLLQWSKSESKQSEVIPAKLDVAKLIDKSLSLLNQKIEEKGISITKDLEKGASAWADEIMTDFVIRNLISNATKYVHKGGNIHISSRLDSERNLCITEIMDDGVGIEPKLLKKLFYLDSTYTTKGTNNESGTGLGLKICKEFISLNHGFIQVKSTQGQGSTFTISLPYKK